MSKTRILANIPSDLYGKEGRLLSIGASNTVIWQENIALIVAEAAFEKANTSGGGFVGPAFDTANTAFLYANTATIQAQSAFEQANTGTTQAQAAFGQANSAYGQANTAIVQAQAAFNQANNEPIAKSSFSQANSAYGQANTGIVQAQDAFGQANSAYGQANTGIVQAQAAFNQANSSYYQANLAFAQANTANNLLVSHESALDPHPQYATLPEVGTVTKDMTGFTGLTTSSLKFDESSRTFTLEILEPTLIYYRGQDFTLTSNLSVVTSNTVGGRFVNFDPETEQLAEGTGSFPDILNELSVAYIHWNANVQQCIILGDERHSAHVDTQWHYSEHRNRGTVWRSGGTISYTLDDVNNISFGLASPINIADEDLNHSIVNSATPNGYFQQEISPTANVSTLYLSGIGYRESSQSKTPWLTGSNDIIVYNQVTGGVGSLVDVTSGKYINYWIIATTDIRRPVKLLIGQNQYDTIDEADAETYTSYGLYFPEMVAMHKVVLNANTSYINTGNVVVSKVTTIRSAQPISTTAFSPSNHAALSGRSDPDQHTILSITNLEPTLSSLHIIADSAAANTIQIQGVNVTQNTNILDLQTQSSIIFDQANTGTTQAQAAFGRANSAYNQANTGILISQEAFGRANSAYGQANNGVIIAQEAFDQANLAFSQANTGVTQAQAAFGRANAAYGQANTANTNATNTNLRTRTINFIIDGDGLEITTGIKGELIVDFSATIISWDIIADAVGSLVVDISKASYANFPTFTASGGTSPTLSSAQKNTSTINWTNFTTITSGDIFRFTVSGTPATITRATVAIQTVTTI
jgi:hypothetical protein